MQGIFINGRRPKSKKEIKDADPATVTLEATSFFGNEYGGPVTEMPENKSATFVGPDPHVSRKFYGTITRKGDKVTIK